METPISSAVRAKVLYEFERDPKIAMPPSYSFSHVYERYVSWLKTPQGTIIRQSKWWNTSRGRHVSGWLFFREYEWEWCEYSSTETHPYRDSMEAIKQLMMDAHVDLNRAAEMLELDSQW